MLEHQNGLQEHQSGFADPWVIERPEPEDKDERIRRLETRVAELEAERAARPAAPPAVDLVESARSVSELLAMLSHELRNPLAPIRNSLYILQHTPAGSEAARRAMDVLDRQVEHLARLVEDLLDVTRLSRDLIQIEGRRVELNGLVRRAMDDHRALFERKGVALSLSESAEPLITFGDPQRLLRVVGKLLQNAVKFTPRGGSVRVTLAADAAGGRAVLRFADTGAGMSPDTLAHLFRPFVQVGPSPERGRDGLGLGLALVKGLVDLHGGEITARSDGLDSGSEIVIRLPLEAPSADESRASRPSDGSGRVRVLIIEDNVDAAETLREALELGEHEVRVAYNGTDGLALARKLRPDVLLCDLGLPGIDGFEVARAFRADESLRGTFLVALSGYSQPEDRRRAQEAGFDRHVAKPPRLSKLEALIASVHAGEHAPALTAR